MGAPHAKTFPVKDGRTVCHVFGKKSAIRQSQARSNDDAALRTVAEEHGIVIIVRKERKRRHILTREIGNEIIVKAVTAFIGQIRLFRGLVFIGRIGDFFFILHRYPGIVCAVAQVTAQKNDLFADDVLFRIILCNRASVNLYAIGRHTVQIDFVAHGRNPFCIYVFVASNRFVITAPTCEIVTASRWLGRGLSVFAVRNKDLGNDVVAVIEGNDVLRRNVGNGIHVRADSLIFRIVFRLCLNVLINENLFVFNRRRKGSVRSQLINKRFVFFYGVNENRRFIRYAIPRTVGLHQLLLIFFISRKNRFV